VHEVMSRPMTFRGFLNVNIPNLPAEAIKGVKATRLGHRRYDYAVEEKLDPRGRPYFWIGGSETEFQDLEGSDCSAVRAGYISVSSLYTDLTDYNALGRLQWVESLAHAPE